MSVIYVSWGGSGRGAALRAAYDEAVEARARLTYLAILDPPHFADLDQRRIELVVEELTWLLTAHLETVAEASSGQVDAAVVVRVGEVDDEVEALAGELNPSAILIGAPVRLRDGSVAELVAALGQRTAVEVRVVEPTAPPIV